MSNPRLYRWFIPAALGALAVVLIFSFRPAVGESKSSDSQLSSIYTDTIAPLVFMKEASNGQFGFISIPASRLEAKLIPNLQQRHQQKLMHIPNVLGVTHFFLDHDLTTGFVHPYTQGFFDRLRPDDFVMKFTRNHSSADQGWVQYVRVSSLRSGEMLGRDLALFRQWKLSEIDMRHEADDLMIHIEPCRFASSCGCPQVSASSNNPFQAEIPIWSKGAKSGYVPLSALDKLGPYDGGTAVIIWEETAGESRRIMFQDVHGSLQTIIRMAMNIAETRDVDPHIAISDAGPFARKVRSDARNRLDCALLEAISPKGLEFGSGFGYVPN